MLPFDKYPPPCLVSGSPLRVIINQEPSNLVLLVSCPCVFARMCSKSVFSCLPPKFGWTVCLHCCCVLRSFLNDVCDSLLRYRARIRRGAYRQSLLTRLYLLDVMIQVWHVSTTNEVCVSCLACHVVSCHLPWLMLDTRRCRAEMV